MNIEIEKVLKWRRQADGFNHMVGIQVEALWEGGSRLPLPLRPELLNPLGSAHGGTIFTLCDAAAGSAAASRGQIAVTLNGSINYLYSGKPNETLTAVAKERKHGHRTAVYDVDVTDTSGQCIATATFTMFYTGKTIEDFV